MCLGVVALIRDRVRSIGRARCRRVHSGLCGYTRERLDMIGFILGSVGSLGRAYWTSGSFRFVHSGASRRLRAFIRVHLGLLRRDHGSSGSLEFAWVHSGAPRVLRVDSYLGGFTGADLVVVWFIRFK